MTKIIYGKEDCPNCALAKELLKDFSYRHHSELYDDYDTDQATMITTSTNGNLPIIVLDDEKGFMVLQLANYTAVSNCKDGVCKIEERVK